MKTLGLVLICVALLGPMVFAHEGHDHKFMGTVSSIQNDQMEMKDTDGKVWTFSLPDKTKIIRGTAVVKPADIKPGDRVVVVAVGSGKKPYVVKEVRVGVRR